MLWFKKQNNSPIGIDITGTCIRAAQLKQSEGSVELVSADVKELPEAITPGSAEWQRWCIDAIKQMLNNGGFKGKGIIAGVNPDDIFIDQIRVRKDKESSLDSIIRERMEKKLPFNINGAMLKYVSTPLVEGSDEMEVSIMAIEKVKVERHLAIFESIKADLKGFNVWPMAIANSFATFYARRKADVDQVVMVIESFDDKTRVVISRHNKLLFARSINIGINHVNNDSDAKKFLAELTACVRYFDSSESTLRIKRVVFLAGAKASENEYVCGAIADLARDFEIPAHIGDMMASVQVSGSDQSIERRGSRHQWATAFGLTLGTE